METKINDLRKISKQGLAQGALSTLIGSAIFAFFNAVAIFVYAQTFETWVFGVLLIVFGISVVLSVVPGLYGGRWLAHLLYRDALAGSLTRKKAIMKGTILGMFAGFGICVFVVTFLYTRGDFNILIFRIISAVVIAGWMGGWAGAKLVDNIAHILK
jgi:hypothetical protein